MKQNNNQSRTLYRAPFTVYRAPCILLFLVWTFPCFAQKTYYVKPDGTPGLTGTSWGWASNDLQATVEKALAGDRIYVAVGTYQGGFILKEGVTVMGGYTANRDNPTERYNLMETGDPARQSILDGGGVQRVLTQYTPFHAPAVWDGFVIKNGSPSVEFKKGSVIYSTTGDKKIAGILYQYDSETGTGMMIGAAETGKQWGGYTLELSGLPIAANKENAKNDLSGWENAEEIVGELDEQSMDFSREDYPLNGNYAAYWCDTLTAGGYEDWYLPSAGELQEVYEANVKTIMKSIGKNLDYGYWTSSHAGNSLAWAYYFGNGHFHPALKYVNHVASGVHPFVAPTQPDGVYFAGGGVFLSENGILKDCIVTDNSSPSQGGGVYVGRGGRLDNCMVEGNDAPEGKEIYYEIPTGILPVKTESLQLYPNPVKSGERISVRLYRSDKADYQILNTAGLTVIKGRLNAGENALTVPTQQGIYLLLLQSENRNYKAKISIQ
jgi:hypothetical protein